MIIEPNNIYLGDCRELMCEIPDKSVDLVLTDPPYGRASEESFDTVKTAIIEFKRISMVQIIILDWRNPLNIDDGKFAELVWEYGWVSGGRTKSNHFYPTHNTIHFLGDENKIRFNTKNGSIITRQPGFSSPRQCSYAKKTGHKYEKPIKLMEYLIKMTDASLILDPFLGSGTTAVACIKTGRRYIGMEIDPTYFEIAQKRIEEEKRDMKIKLFNPYIEESKKEIKKLF